jgi:ABC-2 type transport system ATP-binding protein
MAIIDIHGLLKTYASGLAALKQVDLQIRRGEIFALLGPNGAGKTTLINIVCGIVTASGGQVLVEGKDWQTHYREARTRIGLVPQELHTDAFESVWNTVNFSRGLFGRPRDTAKVESLLKRNALALGRHEAPRDDRQGVVPRAGYPLPRRAQRRR